MERIVLAYSGGLEASVVIPWMRDTHRAEIIAVTVDLGQGHELEEVRDRALAAGAVRAHVLDLREELARDFVVPALAADALRDARAPLSAALARPLMARALVEIAAIEQATAVAHGCTGEGPEPRWLESTVRALNPALRVIAAAREHGMTRAESIAYAGQRHIPLPANLASPHHVDSNLWGRAIACSVPDGPWTDAPEAIFTLTNAPAERPAEPAYVEIAFERGVPAAINGVAMPLLDLIGSLTIIAGAHGVGRIERPVGRIEDGVTRARLRVVHEAPAAVVLHAAHKELQTLVTTVDLEQFARRVSQQYAEVVDTGRWFTPLREALDAFVAHVQQRVTGSVRLELFKGDCRIVARTSSFALDDRAALTPPVGVGA